MFTFANDHARELAERIHQLSRDLKLIEELKAPTIRAFVNAPVIENWRFGQRTETALVGRVQGHPLHRDGPIITSGIYFLDAKAGYARTLSRWYQVGQPFSTNE